MGFRTILVSEDSVARKANISLASRRDDIFVGSPVHLGSFEGAWAE